MLHTGSRVEPPPGWLGAVWGGTVFQFGRWPLSGEVISSLSYVIADVLGGKVKDMPALAPLGEARVGEPDPCQHPPDGGVGL